MASTWTPTTLATHILSSLQQDLNDAVAVPAGLIAIAHDAYEQIWGAHEWNMRYSGTSYTWEPGEETVIALLEAPTLQDTGKPIWEMKFDPGWMLLSLAISQQQFRNDDVWMQTQKAYDNWLVERKEQDDRQYWADLIATADYDMWTLEGMTRQVCIELLNAKTKDTVAVASKRTLLAMVGNIVSDAYTNIWSMHPWQFRRKRTTLTATADTAVLALPSDFERMDDRWMQDEEDQGQFELTIDVERFELYRRAHDDDTGVPLLALIETDEEGGWQLRFTPPPDSADEYVIVYLCIVDPLAIDDSPAWPDSFNKGWQSLARLEAHRRFGSTRGAEIASKEFKEWYSIAISQNDRPLVRSQPIERDAYGDFGSEYAYDNYWDLP